MLDGRHWFPYSKSMIAYLKTATKDLKYSALEQTSASIITAPTAAVTAAAAVAAVAPTVQESALLLRSFTMQYSFPLRVLPVLLQSILEFYNGGTSDTSSSSCSSTSTSTTKSNAKNGTAASDLRSSGRANKLVELKFLRSSASTFLAPNSTGSAIGDKEQQVEVEGSGDIWARDDVFVCLNVWWECIDSNELLPLQYLLRDELGGKVHFGKWHDTREDKLSRGNIAAWEQFTDSVAKI